MPVTSLDPRVIDGPVRLGALVRRATLDAARFGRHWAGAHAPLVAGSADFRTFTRHYTQDHIEETVVAARIAVDGFSSTLQAPRADPSVGFFESADYPRVRADEAEFLDLDATVMCVYSVEAARGSRGPYKLTVFAPPSPSNETVRSLGRRVLAPVAGTARTLRGQAAPPHSDFVVQEWFGDQESCRSAAARWSGMDGVVGVWLVREHSVF